MRPLSKSCHEATSGISNCGQHPHRTHRLPDYMPREEGLTGTRCLFGAKEVVTVLSFCLECGLVSWCLEPSQPQRITSGLNTNFNQSPRYTFHKSTYHKSCFLSLFIFRGHSTSGPTSNRVTYFILHAYTGTGISHCQHRKLVS